MSVPASPEVQQHQARRQLQDVVQWRKSGHRGFPPASRSMSLAELDQQLRELGYGDIVDQVSER